MEIKIENKYCSKHENRCHFFDSGICEDGYYSNNPYCYLYKKEIKVISSQGGCDNFEHDEDEWFDVKKPSFCKVKNIIIEETI